MAVEEKRLMKMIYLLSQTDGYLTAGELAKQLNLSERTIKSEAEHLRNFLQRCGCTLESVRGKGYTLRVDDPAHFEQTREWVHILFNNVENDIKDKHPYQLARAIMCLETADTDGYFRLEHLADRLYISVSTLKKGMPWVREFLDSFGLSLHSRPGKGLKICGDELSQRLCLLELYENHFRKRVVSFNNHVYERAFADHGDKDQIRKKTLDVIRNSETELLDAYCNRLVDYLLLQRNRTAQGLWIQENASPWTQWIADLSQLSEWKLARNLAASLEEIPGFSFSQPGEIAAIAVLMLIWADWEGVLNLTTRFPTFAPKAWQMAEALSKKLADMWGFPESADLSQALFPEFLRLLLQQKFGYNRCQMLGNSCSENNIKKSPLTMALADILGELLQESYDLAISEFNTQLLAVAIYRAIDAISYPYTPRRLLICARNGKASAQVISHDIRRRLGDWWIDSITVSPLYEARKFPPEDFDALIGTFYTSAYRYVWPYTKIHSPMAPDDYEVIRREVLLKGYDITQTAEAVRWDILEFHRNFATSDLPSILQLLAYQWGIDLTAKERLASFFADRHHLRPHHQLLVAIVPASYTGRQILELYELAKPLEYDGESVRAVLFLSAHFRSNPAVLRFLEHSMRILQEEFERLSEQLTPQNLAQILTEEIRKHL